MLEGEDKTDYNNDLNNSEETKEDLKTQYTSKSVQKIQESMTINIGTKEEPLFYHPSYAFFLNHLLVISEIPYSVMQNQFTSKIMNLPQPTLDELSQKIYIDPFPFKENTYRDRNQLDYIYRSEFYDESDISGENSQNKEEDGNSRRNNKNSSHSDESNEYDEILRDTSKLKGNPNNIIVRVYLSTKKFTSSRTLVGMIVFVNEQARNMWIDMNAKYV